MRSIHFDEGDIWTYKIGRVNVVIRDTENRSHIVKKNLVGEVDRYVDENGEDKERIIIKPSLIKKYIEDNLR